MRLLKTSLSGPEGPSPSLEEGKVAPELLYFTEEAS